MHNAGLILDWMPAFAMSLVLSTYLWTRIVRKWYFGLFIVTGFYVLSFILMFTLIEMNGNRDLGINLGYFLTGTCYIIPIFIVLGKTNWYKFRLVLFSFLLLSLALLCRALDYPTPNPFPNLLPQGTHFMWHVFSSFAVFTMGYYVYFINKIDLSDKSTYPEEAVKGG